MGFILGMDTSPIIQAMRDTFNQNITRSAPLSQGPPQLPNMNGNPFAIMQGIQNPDPLRGFSGRDPFAGLSYDGRHPTGSSFGSGPLFSNLVGAQQNVAQLRAKAAEKGLDLHGKPLPKAPTTGSSGGVVRETSGEGWAMPTVAQIDEVLKGTPMEGRGALIDRLAQQYGVPVSLALGIFQIESQFGKFSAGGNTQFNWGGLKNVNGNGFATFATPEEGIEAIFKNMATPIYKNKTAYEFISTWAPSTDGNDPYGYANSIIALDTRLGGRATTNSRVEAPGPLRQGNVAPTGDSVLRTMFGGRLPSIGQPFGPSEYSAKPGDEYKWATAYGVPLNPNGNAGHPGIDFDLPVGTAIYAPTGAKIVIVGGKYYGSPETGGTANGQSGEVMLELPNGDQIILGHLSKIDRTRINEGYDVSAGQLIGYSGSSGGPHLHLEIRKKTPQGYQLVDPLTYNWGNTTTRQ